ncbi:hypothetical protein BC830DRAFT_805365 [Chytriomyces sp. MP71]|nr:hypothetical protein BC830DRAFT_805365 [Chytriomyces sp. MP71]
MVPEPVDGFENSDISHYVDKRIQVRTWFQIICYFANSCCVLESKPDLFKATQSWGWRSTKVYKYTFGEVDGPAALMPGKCSNALLLLVELERKSYCLYEGYAAD